MFSDEHPASETRENSENAYHCYRKVLGLGEKINAGLTYSILAAISFKIRGLTIKSANWPLCACRGSSGQKCLPAMAAVDRNLNMI
jgi:hypothetical protein